MAAIVAALEIAKLMNTGYILTVNKNNGSCWGLVATNKLKLGREKMRNNTTTFNGYLKNVF